MMWLLYMVWVVCLAGTHVVYRKMVRLARSEGYWHAWSDMTVLNEWVTRSLWRGEGIAWVEYCQVRDQLAQEFTGLDEGWDGIDRVTFYELRP